MLIVWVRATYDAAVTSDALAETYNRRGFTHSQCLEGSWGAAWYSVSPNVAAPNEVVVTKHCFSPFWDTAIDLYLRCNEIHSVVVTGVVTSGCVDSTVRDAFFNDYYVVVAEDCVAEASQERHDAALRKLAQAFGVVLPADDIMSAWDASPHRAAAWQLQTKAAKQLHERRDRLDPAHTALLLVDAPDAACAQAQEPMPSRQGMAQANALLSQARARHVLVVHLRTERGVADASDVQLFLRQRIEPPASKEPSASAADPSEPFTPRPGETVVVQHRASGFVDTSLEKLLRANRIRTVVLAGIDMQQAIDSTARHAAMLDFYVVVPRDCIATHDLSPALHRASLEIMARYFADVCEAKEIMSCWQDTERQATAADANAALVAVR